jgi:hypothetical protein
VGEPYEYENLVYRRKGIALGNINPHPTVTPIGAFSFSNVRMAGDA